MADQNDPLRGLPEWPKEARDLPDDGPGAAHRDGPAHTWLLSLGAGGAALGFLFGVGYVGGGLAGSVGGAVGLGLIGVLVGFLADRTVWNDANKPGR